LLKVVGERRARSTLRSAPWEVARRATRLDYASPHRLVEVSLYMVWVLLGLLAAVAITLLWLVTIAIYTVLVMPVAYPAYAAMRFSLFAIRDGDAEPEKVVLYPGVDPRQIVRDHMVSLRGRSETVGPRGSGWPLIATRSWCWLGVSPASRARVWLQCQKRRKAVRNASRFAKSALVSGCACAPDAVGGQFTAGRHHACALRRIGLVELPGGLAHGAQGQGRRSDPIAERDRVDRRTTSVSALGGDFGEAGEAPA
jgi:hypothetical protein